MCLYKCCIADLMVMWIEKISSSVCGGAAILLKTVVDQFYDPPYGPNLNKGVVSHAIK